MSGYYQMQRGWRDHEFFGNEEYSERDAWGWLIEAAAWKPLSVRIKGQRVDLERGQLTAAQRFMAEKWGWSKSRVDRFLKRLASEGMIISGSKCADFAGQQRGNSGATTGATNAHAAGQGQAIITICNYDKYQSQLDDERGNTGAMRGAGRERDANQKRGKEEEEKKERIDDDDARAQAPAKSLPESLADAEPVDLSDMQTLAQECARAAGTRQADPVQFGRDINLCRDWIAAGADAELILEEIRGGVVACTEPRGVSSLRYFDQRIRTAAAKRKALENGTVPPGPRGKTAGPVDEVAARAVARMAARRAADPPGGVELLGRAE